MTTITEAFYLPRPEDIRAMGFVIKLREADAGSDEVKQLVDDYVITPTVQAELPRILDGMKQVFDRGEEYGRFIHGSFGSGKSHFMTMLSMLLERVGPAWEKFRPVLAAHRAGQASAAAVDHEAWLPDANLLVVRIHMLSVRGKDTGLDRAIYDGFNQALARRGKEAFEFLNVDGLFDEVRREADAYGDIVWTRLAAAGIIGGRDDLEAVAAGSERGRERFARAWLEHKGRDAAQAGIDPRWSEGLVKMAAHAKAEGFGGIVLMIDELLLWLAEKSPEEFSREINNLNIIVDHSTGQRPLPIFVFVAVQRNPQEFFPDLVEEAKVHAHLDHHSKRFELTNLEDVELRHIVRGRVLRPRDAAAVARAIDGLADAHQKVLPGLLAGGDIAYLRDVYPFHPALVEMLVDVTALMQRERSALRLLYELLVLHYPNLPLGEFLPVGSAFAAIFPESGVEASKKIELMQDVHHQYYSRLKPALDGMAEGAGGELDAERRRALDQIVKTVLLAEVSPRLKQNGLTVERLVQLNSVDVEGETFRGRLRVVQTDLMALSQRVPDLLVAGEGSTAIVRFVLGRVSLGEILTRARSKVDNSGQVFRVFWGALKAALKVEGLKGFEEGGTNAGEWELMWRRTRRRGAVKLGNVREMSYDDFDPPEGAFKVLIDYPWDEPGHTVDEDRLRATNVRKKKGDLHTVCWLPRHFAPDELSLLTDLAAVRYLASGVGQEDLLGTLGAQDRKKALEQASIRASSLEGRLAELLVDVYVNQGEFLALASGLDTRRPHKTLHENLEHIATVLMDRRYGPHPSFGAEPRKAELELLLKWMVEAGEVNQSTAYDDATGKVLRTLGQPLEVVNLGQTKASLRLDSRYIKDVLQKTDQDSIAWRDVADHLRDTYGLQPIVVDMFLAFLCQRDHRALRRPSGEPVDVHIGMSASVDVMLQRGKLVVAPEWHRLRDLGHQLFGEARPAAHRSLQAQDRFAAKLREWGRTRRVVLQGLHERLTHLGVESGARLVELGEANERLGPLVQSTTDSHKTLSDLLAKWPDDPSDPLRAVVHGAEAVREALGALNDNARKNLGAGEQHPKVGADVRDHIAMLNGRLAGAQAELPLDRKWVQAWNAKAQELIQRLIERVEPIEPIKPVEPDKPDKSVRPDPPPPHLYAATVNPRDADAIGVFLGGLREVVTSLSSASVRLVVTVEKDGE